MVGNGFFLRLVVFRSLRKKIGEKWVCEVCDGVFEFFVFVLIIFVFFLVYSL